MSTTTSDKAPMVSAPTAADLRTAVNQIQSLLLLLDSDSDLVPPASSSGREGLLPGTTPRLDTSAEGGAAVSATPADGAGKEAAGGNKDKAKADGDANDAASDSSDAPLMQQQHPAQQTPRDGAGKQPNSTTSQGNLAQPGLTQVLPALLLPLQPATPASIAQLNMASIAMGFPDIMTRYRGAVQHAFNLVVDLQRGIQMLSNPMPDLLDPQRTHEAALGVAARLLRETARTQRLQERTERVQKRQRGIADEVEARKKARAAPGTVDIGPSRGNADAAKDSIKQRQERLAELLSEGGPALLQDGSEAGLRKHLDVLQRALEDRKLHLSIARWRAKGVCHVRMDMPNVGAAYVAFAAPGASPAPASLVRITLRSPVEEQELAVRHASTGLSTLPFDPSRFATYRTLSASVYRLALQLTAPSAKGAKEGTETAAEAERPAVPAATAAAGTGMSGPWDPIHGAAIAFVEQTKHTL